MGMSYAIFFMKEDVYLIPNGTDQLCTISATCLNIKHENDFSVQYPFKSYLNFSIINLSSLIYQ